MSLFMTLNVSDKQDWFVSEDGAIPLEYAEAGDKGEIERDMYGCQYSASGYMDQTDWCLAPTALEAVRECGRLYGGEFIKGEDDEERADLACAYRYARSLDRAARKAPKG